MARLRAEQDARIALYSSIQFLLERHLGGCEGWPREGWVDGFYAERIRVISPDTLEIPGYFIWMEEQKAAWLEVGFSAVQLAPNSDQLSSYVLKFGDASKGLATWPYKRDHGHVWAAPKEWMFVFERPRNSEVNNVTG